MAIALASLALVPVPFILLARAFGLEIDAVMVGAGAGGWCVHLAVRMPAIALLSRWQREWWGVWLSGPMEEGIRVFLVLALADTAGEAYSLGLGWGLVEIPYHLLEALMLYRLGTLPAAGSAPQPSPLASGVDALMARPWSLWRTLERVAATSIHIGLSLVMFWAPLVVLAAVPAHSLLNHAFLKAVAVSVPWAEAVALALGGIILATGLAAAL